EALDKIIPFSKRIIRIDDDPISFLSHSNPIRKYDIIIINSGEPDNYKNNRFLTDRFLKLSKTLLKNDGIIFFPSHYDTDRYISQDKAGIISAIYNTLQNSFAHVTVWPGDMTLFFASDSSLFNLTSDSLIGRIKNLGYYPQYINENYLADRLQNFKMEKLRDALDSFGQINTLNRPILVYRQTAYRAKLGGIDNKIIPALFNVAPRILLLSSILWPVLSLYLWS
ncbi:MAG: hypothetical protein NTV06_09245, partial [candidate division Zixibacteria bacterium]|nr:hypothetical protein [candidate division Zixibacteria bacterium]